MFLPSLNHKVGITIKETQDHENVKLKRRKKER